MEVTPTVAGRVANLQQRIARRTSMDLLRLWDGLESWTAADADAFHAAAQPYVRNAATASIDLTESFASLIVDEPAPVRDLVVDDAAARLYDPFDRLGHQLAKGSPWPDAASAARSVVATIGRDSVYRTGRVALAQACADSGVDRWQRRLGPNSCDWCLRLAKVTWPTAAAAAFGHDNCNCIPIPAASIGDHNDRMLAQRAELGDFEADQVAYDQRRSLRRQAATARRRQLEARDERLDEPDPDRRERLSIREQEWETRAEMAEDRLRLLTAGDRRAAA